MAVKAKIFLSYSHADESLKKELLGHLSGIIRRGDAEIWHDRMIQAGVLLHEEIEDVAYRADIFLFLISSDFIKSEYCMTTEYKIAAKRHEAGECQIVPIILRKCDWKVEGLERFNVKPTDAIAVTNNAYGNDGLHKRDEAWTDIVEGISEVVLKVKERTESAKIEKEYQDSKYINTSYVNPSVEILSDDDLFVDPDIYSEATKESIPKFNDFCRKVQDSEVTILIGDDQSGKSTLCKKLQDYLIECDEPSVILMGKDISNADIENIVRRKIAEQFEGSISRQATTVILDNFDECKLPDQIKEKIVRHLTKYFKRTLLTTFSGAPSVLYAADDLPSPEVYSLGGLSNSKVYKLVGNWHSLSLERNNPSFENKCLNSYELIAKIFEQTHLDKFPAIILYYLQIMESYSGTDIYLSSFAACYDTVIAQKMLAAGAQHNEIDEGKNFLCALAYKSYVGGLNGAVSSDILAQTYAEFEREFFSSKHKLSKHAFETFVDYKDDEYRFREDYIWYFLVARYIGKVLIVNDYSEFKKTVDDVALEIFSKKSANIIIYIAYFTNDAHIISSILEIMDSLFDRADQWELSDHSRSLILGLFPQDQAQIQSKSDVDEGRSTLLDEKSENLLEEAEKVVARYALPFLSQKIGDADFTAQFSADEFDADSYLRSVNALLRTHSVLGQILGARIGTYPANQVMNCITRMVMASGRFTSLNHAIATVMLSDLNVTQDEVERAFKTEGSESKRMMRKTLRIFGFWSVYLSQAGLARYLRQDHNVRALKRLVDKYESVDSSKQNPTPFNFSSVYLIAKFYSTEDFDPAEIETFRKRFGSDSGLWALMRAVINLYSYYLPLKIDKKQWLANTFRMNLRRLESQQAKAPKRLPDVKK